MQDKLEKIVRLVYRNWKESRPKTEQPHPDEQTLACFAEGRLAAEEAGGILSHLLTCDSCMEALSVSLKLKETALPGPSAELIDRIRNMLESEARPALLEIILRLKEKALEIIQTTGDVLVGQELVPAPVLRSRSIKILRMKSRS